LSGFYFEKFFNKRFFARIKNTQYRVFSEISSCSSEY
jgi:hypothetical protein